MDIKNFENFLNESKNIGMIPDLGKKVVCCDGGKYEIVDYCATDDTSNVNTILRKYDESGAMRDAFVNHDYDCEYFVALRDLDDDTYSVWQWEKGWVNKYL